MKRKQCVKWKSNGGKKEGQRNFILKVKMDIHLVTLGDLLQALVKKIYSENIILENKEEI